MNQDDPIPPPLPPTPASGWRTFGIAMLWIFAVIGFGATMCTVILMLAS
jgi:hypothetical protein